MNMAKKLGVVMVGCQVSGRLERVDMRVIRMHYMHVYNCQKANVIFQKPIKLATGINVTMK